MSDSARDADVGSPPLVSVITAVYNGERFLGEAIESVIAQDHRPIELLVVDDGSTDRSAEIARSYEQVILVQQPNRGLAAARNAALDRAEGSFITFLDADDRMAPGRLTTQLAYLAANEQVGCVLMHQELILEPGMTVPAWVRPFGAPDEVVGGFTITAMVRREAQDLIGGFDPTLPVCEDVEWLIRLRDAGVGVEILPLLGTYRRIHGDNMSHQTDTIRTELADILRARLERQRHARTGEGG